jgi:hypothetical protein
MYVYQDVDPTTPFEVDPAGVNAGASTTATALGFTPTVANAEIIACFSMDRDRITNDQATGGTGSFTTDTLHEIANANGCACGMSDKTHTTGDTGTATHTLSTSDGWHAVQIALNPVSAGFAHSQGYVIG